MGPCCRIPPSGTSSRVVIAFLVSVKINRRCGCYQPGASILKFPIILELMMLTAIKITDWTLHTVHPKQCACGLKVYTSPLIQDRSNTSRKISEVEVTLKLFQSASFKFRRLHAWRLTHKHHPHSIIKKS